MGDEPKPDAPEFLTRKEFTEWQATQSKTPAPTKDDDHDAEPDDDYVPAWAKQLNDKVDKLGKSPSGEQEKQTPPNTQVTKVEPPPPVVEPKRDFWPKGWPKIL